MNFVNWLIKKGILVTVSVLVFSKSAFAIPIPTDLPQGCNWCAIPNTFSTIFNIIILVAFIIFIVLFFIFCIQYLLAVKYKKENLDKNKAKRRIWISIVGIIIVLGAWAIGSWYFNQLYPQIIGLQ